MDSVQEVLSNGMLSEINQKTRQLKRHCLENGKWSGAQYLRHLAREKSGSMEVDVAVRRRWRRNAHIRAQLPFRFWSLSTCGHNTASL